MLNIMSVIELSYQSVIANGYHKRGEENCTADKVLELLDDKSMCANAHENMDWDVFGMLRDEYRFPSENSYRNTLYELLHEKIEYGEESWCVGYIASAVANLLKKLDNMKKWADVPTLEVGSEHLVHGVIEFKGHNFYGSPTYTIKNEFGVFNFSTTKRCIDREEVLLKVKNMYQYHDGTRGYNCSVPRKWK